MQNKKHEKHPFLDGIRGIAALFVVAFHFPLFFAGFQRPRAYLAVDLFFILSGYVIAMAYDRKLRTKSISAAKFMAIRFVRLYPVFVFSVFLGAIPMLWHDFGIHMGGRILNIGLAFLLLPSLPMAATSPLFFINLAYWSLMFEVIVNVIYACVRPVLSTRNLWVWVVASGLLTLAAVLRKGSLQVGWTGGWFSLGGGLARSVFSIFLGLLIFRHRRMFRKFLGRRTSSWLGVLAIVVILASPVTPGWDAIVDFVSVALVFPAGVLISAKGLAGKWPTRAFLVLGSASYPIYVIHVPLGLILENLLGNQFIGQHAPMIGLLYMVALIAFSVAMEKFYDIPVRRWLSKRLVGSTRIKRPAAGSEPTPAAP